MIADEEYVEATCAECDRPLGYELGGYWDSEGDLCGSCQGGQEDDNDEASTWEYGEM